MKKTFGVAGCGFLGNIVLDSYKLGLSSIRRIAQDYEGQVQIAEDADTFSITVTLSKF